MPQSSVRIDEKGIQELFNSSQGDVYKYMEQQAKKIVFVAKRKVGKETHALERSIGYRMLRTPGGVFAEVGATNKVALLHHQGSRPHVILPQRGRALRFKSGGRVVYARQVFHPGTRPNPYLVTALREVIK